MDMPKSQDLADILKHTTSFGHAGLQVMRDFFSLILNGQMAKHTSNTWIFSCDLLFYS